MVAKNMDTLCLHAASRAQISFWTALHNNYEGCSFGDSARVALSRSMTAKMIPIIAHPAMGWILTKFLPSSQGHDRWAPPDSQCFFQYFCWSGVAPIWWHDGDTKLPNIHVMPHGNCKSLWSPKDKNKDAYVHSIWDIDLAFLSWVWWYMIIKSITDIIS